MQYNKSFIIIGDSNKPTKQEFFAYIKNNKIWLGVSIKSGDREFRVPNDYPLQAAGFRVDEQGNKYIRVKGVRWFTNLDVQKRHELLFLAAEYSAEKYLKFDNYDAINVDETKLIPNDYFGIMGVPITFLDKYNPEQFEIVGIMASTKLTELNYGCPCINGENKFARILIKRKAAMRSYTIRKGENPVALTLEAPNIHMAINLFAKRAGAVIQSADISNEEYASAVFVKKRASRLIVQAV